MLCSFLSEHYLSFHDHICKISDPDSGLFLSALGLDITDYYVALHFQKKYWLVFTHFHYKITLKFNLRAPISQNFLHALRPPSIFHLIQRAPLIFYAPGPLISIGASAVHH